MTANGMDLHRDHVGGVQRGQLFSDDNMGEEEPSRSHDSELKHCPPSYNASCFKLWDAEAGTCFPLHVLLRGKLYKTTTFLCRVSR